MRMVHATLAMTSLVACRGWEDSDANDDATAALVFAHDSEAPNLHREPADVPILAGASFVLTGKHPEVRILYEAHSSNDAVATIKETGSSCVCRGGAQGLRAIGLEAPCDQGESRDCRVDIHGRAVGPGDATLTVFTSGRRFAREVPIHVRAASSIEPRVFTVPSDALHQAPSDPHPHIAWSRQVAVMPGSDGSFSIPLGNIVRVDPRVLDTDGNQLHYAGAGQPQSTGTADGVLLPLYPNGNYVGRAAQPGATIVTLSVAGPPSTSLRVPLRVSSP